MTDSEGPHPAVWWGLGIYLVAMALVVFSPVSYSSIVAAIAGWLHDDLGVAGFGSGWIEFAANVAMFLPLGLLLTLLVRHHWHGAAIAIVLSAAVELVQVLLPARVPSVRDIVANGLGAAIGAAVAWFLLRPRSRRSAGEHTR